MKNKYFRAGVVACFSLCCLIGCANESGGSSANSNSTTVLSEYKITFETNGGTSVPSLKGTVTYSPKTTKDGYDFVSWCKDSTLYQAVSFPFTPTSNTILYAKWKEKTYPVESVQLSKEEGYVYSGINLELTASVLPKTAIDNDLTWTSSNQNVAIVSKTGIVSYAGSGSAIIKATASNGVYGECRVYAGTLVTLENSSSGSLYRDDGVGGQYSNLKWNASGSPTGGQQYGSLTWTFKQTSGTASRGGVYIYVYDRNGSMVTEKWYQFGLVTPYQSFDCSCDLAIPLESFYSIKFGSDGKWYHY